MSDTKKKTRPKTDATDRVLTSGSISLSRGESLAVLLAPESLRVSVIDLLISPDCFDEAQEKAAKLSHYERVRRGLALLHQLNELTAKQGEAITGNETDAEKRQQVERYLAEVTKLFAKNDGKTESFLDVASVDRFLDRFLVEAAESMLCDSHSDGFCAVATAVLSEREAMDEHQAKSSGDNGQAETVIDYDAGLKAVRSALDAGKPADKSVS